MDRRTKRLRKATWIGGLTLAIFTGLALWKSFFSSGGNTPGGSPTRPSFEALLTDPPEAVQGLDVARVNLLCAQGLPGTVAADADGALRLLQEMASHMTLRHAVEDQRVTV